MKRLLLILFTIHSALFASSQEVISLSGSWQFALGDSTKYQDYVLLPGSMQTNDIILIPIWRSIVRKET